LKETDVLVRAGAIPVDLDWEEDDSSAIVEIARREGKRVDLSLYDENLMRGDERCEARELVREKLEGKLDIWEK
jgi:hypothetical protein